MGPLGKEASSAYLMRGGRNSVVQYVFLPEIHIYHLLTLQLIFIVPLHCSLSSFSFHHFVRFNA